MVQIKQARKALLIGMTAAALIALGACTEDNLTGIEPTKTPFNGQTGGTPGTGDGMAP